MTEKALLQNQSYKANQILQIKYYKSCKAELLNLFTIYYLQKDINEDAITFQVIQKAY